MEPMSITGFHSVTLTTPDVTTADAAYRTLFGPAVDAETTTGAVQLISGDAAGASAVRFTVDDLDASTRLLRRRGLALSDDPAPAVGIHGVTLSITDETRSEPLSSGAAPVDIVGLDHIVYTTAEPDRAVATLGARLGLDLRLDQTKFQGMRQLFFRCGDGFLELLVTAGTEVSSAAPGDEAIWGIAWRSVDLDATHARLTAAGMPVSEIRDGRKPGTRVCTVRDRALAVPTILIEQSSSPSTRD